MRKRHMDEGTVARQEDIPNFIVDCEQMNRTKETVQFDRRKLKRFYEDLLEDKTVLDYIGHREHQLAGGMKEEKLPTPELGCTEYLHLLRTARALGYVSTIIRGVYEKTQISSEKGSSQYW